MLKHKTKKKSKDYFLKLTSSSKLRISIYHVFLFEQSLTKERNQYEIIIAP